MNNFFWSRLLVIPVALFAFSCTPAKRLTQPTANIKSLKYLSTYHIPYNLQYNQTTVGGLSGIDYDSKKGVYYLLSDDRSDKNPARFYTAGITVTATGIDTMVFTGVQYLKQPDEKFYPGILQNRRNTPDPESIRINSLKKYLVWSSEGERIVKPNDTVLVDPSVLMINKKGKYLDSFSIPQVLKMKATENGPRRNGVLEGLSFADNYRWLYASAEEPFYEDGPRADIKDNNAFIRIFKFDTRSKTNTAQYAYKLEPVAFNAKPENEFKINGVPEILSLGHDKLLVVERSFSTGRLPCTIRLFVADLKPATDITNTALKTNQAFVPAKKTLLLNLDDLGIYTDNIEGVTFGPVLPNGHQTLLFVADNNFNQAQLSQVLLFEVLED